MWFEGSVLSCLSACLPAAGVIKLAHDAIMFLGPFLLEVLLNHLQSQGAGGWLRVAGLLAAGCRLLAGWMRSACQGTRWEGLSAGPLKLTPSPVPLDCPLLLPLAPPCSAAWVGLGLASALAGASVLETLTINLYFHQIFRICLHLKVGGWAPAVWAD